MSQKERSRGWCYTLNNYTEADIDTLKALYDDMPSCEYHIMAFEEGKNKTKHIQGFIYFKEAKSFRRMKLILITAHLEPSKAKNPVNAYCYCMKDGHYIEYGTRPRQGHRTDLEVIKHDILNNKPIKQISSEYFSQWCQYRRAFDEFKKMHSQQNTKLMLYDNTKHEVLHILFKDLYNPYLDKLWNSYDVDLNLTSVYQSYHSKEYRYVFLPCLIAINLKLQLENFNHDLVE